MVDKDHPGDDLLSAPVRNPFRNCTDSPGNRCSGFVTIPYVTFQPGSVVDEGYVKSNANVTRSARGYCLYIKTSEE